MKDKKILSLVIRWLILIVVLIAIYLPIALIILYSFSEVRDLGGEYGSFSFGLYAKLFQNKELMTATINTLIIGLVSAFLATILGSVTAIGIHYMTKMRKVVDTASQITVVNAEIVTAMGFYLLFIFLRDVVHLSFDLGLGWLIIAHTVITTPYVILSVSPRLKQLNPNLLEASMDLGATPIRSLVTVMLPQLFGSMISGFALAFTLSLDDFVVTSINGGKTYTISTFVYNHIRRSGVLPEVRSLSTIIFLFVLIAMIVVNIVKNKNLKKEK